MITHKRCVTCEEFKSVADFAMRAASSDGKKSKCRRCDAVDNRRRRLPERERSAAYRHALAHASEKTLLARANAADEAAKARVLARASAAAAARDAQVCAMASALQQLAELVAARRFKQACVAEPEVITQPPNPLA